MRFRGHIVTGVGQGALLTNLAWVVKRYEEEMGSKPFPGTLNVKIIEEDQSLLAKMFAEKDFYLFSPDPKFCNASAKKVFVNTIPGIAVFPSEEVHIYGREVIEIIAACPIRKELGLNTGDIVEISDCGQ